MGIAGSKCGKHYKIQAKKTNEVVENGQTVLFNVCNREQQQQETATTTTNDEVSIIRHSSLPSQEFSSNINSKKLPLRGSTSSLSSTSSSELLTSNGTAESSGNLKSILVSTNKSSPTAKPLRSVTLILDKKEKEEIFASSHTTSKHKGRRRRDKDSDPIEEDCIDIRVLSRRASLPSINSFETLSTPPDRKITGNFFYSEFEPPFSPAESNKTAPAISVAECCDSPSIRIIPPPEDLLECEVYPLPKKHLLRDEKARKLQEKRLNPVKTWSKDELRKLAKKTKRAVNPIADDLMIYK